MEYNDIIQILKPTYIDYYSKNKTEIKDALRINDQIFYCFSSPTELNDFITYTDCLMNNPSKNELRELLKQIEFKNYFFGLYELVKTHNKIYYLNQNLNPLYNMVTGDIIKIS